MIELNNEIIDYIKNIGFKKQNLIAKKYLEILESNAKELNFKNFYEYIYYIKNNNSLPNSICPICQNKKEFRTLTIPYNYYCSSKCKNSDMSQEIKNKISKTVKSNFENMSDLDKIKFSESIKEGFQNMTETDKNLMKLNISKAVKKRHSEELIDYEKISKSLKTSEKAKKQRIERSKKGQIALQEKINNMTETEKEEYFQFVMNKFKESMLKRYGVENPMFLDEFVNKVYNTRVKRGDITPNEKLSDFKLYYRLVWKYTNRQNYKILENSEKRGKFGFHLDHKYSIFQGFKDNILPQIIGNLVNLEFLNSGKNLSKNKKCSISKEELFKLYFNNK